MAAYEYTALDAQGRELRGVLDGDSARQIRQLLRDQSLLPVTVAEVSDKPPARSFSFGILDVSRWIRLRPPRLRATTASFGLICFVTMCMDSPDSVGS